MEFQKMRPKSVIPEKRTVNQPIDQEKRTQSANIRKQSVSFIDVNLYRNYEESEGESDDDIIDRLSEVNNRRYSASRNDTLDIQRNISTSSKSSGEAFPGSKHSTKSSDGSNEQSKRRGSSNTYNPDAEKAAAFLHCRGKNFSRTNTSLTPVRYAMKNLQISYSETNTDKNHGVIFFDLLKSAQKKDAIRGTSIRSLERRLKLQRINPERSTSFYENKNLHDPYRTIDKKPSRTSLQKKKDRKEKIKKTTEKIHKGYVPAFKTLKMASRKEVEDIGRYCRYLRMEPLRASPDSDHS
ncbi:hypothetical protein CHS0354_042605 [Potamilus streckersoni]|uniref:Uncharacterized protein n=1 Tax=Potamilus streckersoni TaxID=2493646 RepID=A0AAE0WAY5_9BIVA|nr:hypothetical protein CHS0354_042605 [Potamilus streckersoni]